MAFDLSKNEDFQRLFLLELLVDSVKFDYKKVDLSKSTLDSLKQTCVRFNFLDFPVIEVCEEDFCQTQGNYNLAPDIVFRNGKSCFFSLRGVPHSTQCLKLGATIVRQKDEPPPVVMGTTCITLGKGFVDVLNDMNHNTDTGEASNSLKDVFPIIDRKGIKIGSLALLIRLSSFGKAIITHFKIPQETEVGYLFANTNERDQQVNPMSLGHPAQNDQVSPPDNNIFYPGMNSGASPGTGIPETALGSTPMGESTPGFQSKFPEGAPNTFPGAAQGSYPGTAQGGFSGTPQGGFPEAPQGGFPGAPQGGFHGTPQGGFHGTPQGGFHGTPQGGFPGAPQGGFPGATQGGFPGATQGGFPGATQGGFPGATQGGFPGATQGGFPGATQGGFPGATQGGFPGATQGGFPEAPRGNFPGAPQGNFPGAPQGNFPGAPLGNFPGAEQGGFPGAPLGGFTGTAQGGFPGAAQGGFLEAVPGFFPEADTGIYEGGLPGTFLGTAPNIYPAAGPGTYPGFMPTSDTALWGTAGMQHDGTFGGLPMQSLASAGEPGMAQLPQDGPTYPVEMGMGESMEISQYNSNKLVDDAIKSYVDNNIKQKYKELSVSINGHEFTINILRKSRPKKEKVQPLQFCGRIPGNDNSDTDESTEQQTNEEIEEEFRDKVDEEKEEEIPKIQEPNLVVMERKIHKTNISESQPMFAPKVQQNTQFKLCECDVVLPKGFRLPEPPSETGQSNFLPTTPTPPPSPPVKLPQTQVDSPPQSASNQAIQSVPSPEPLMGVSNTVIKDKEKILTQGKVVEKAPKTIYCLQPGCPMGFPWPPNIPQEKKIIKVPCCSQMPMQPGSVGLKGDGIVLQLSNGLVPDVDYHQGMLNITNDDKKVPYVLKLGSSNLLKCKTTKMIVELPVPKLKVKKIDIDDWYTQYLETDNPFIEHKKVDGGKKKKGKGGKKGKGKKGGKKGKKK